MYEQDSSQGNVAIENGTIKAAFSISDSKQIYFSQGNLQYQASTGTWRFAEHQYDLIGSDNSNISSSYSGWIDLFGWGTSGYNGKNPYMTSTSYSDYGDGSNDIAGTNYDWGVYNKIFNGGNQVGMWRTLTNSEWDYLIYGRAQASRLWGQGRVSNVNGLILLPDGWEMPSSVKFTSIPHDYSTNVYSLDEWSVMESYGAVFLPAAGYRYWTEVDNVGSGGDYWSSSTYNDYAANLLYFASFDVGASFNERYHGHSVRLVHDIGGNVESNIVLPTISTGSVSNISSTEATINGTVYSDEGADVTERGVCWNTTGNPTVSDNKKANGSGIGSFSVSITDLEEGTKYYVRAYATNSKGTAYGETVSFTTKTNGDNPVNNVEGAIQAAFSVSDTKKVYFSQGNLQYQASTNTWRFAEKQYDMIGNDNSNISSTYSGWIDLFGWGTSGYNGKSPYMTSTEEGDYGNGENDIAGTNYDWGVYNKISNGGNQAGEWRTLTNDEWDYLIKERPNASNKNAAACVNGIYGFVFLPDNCSLPSGLSFILGYDHYGIQNYYTMDEWTRLESIGAVFLPAARMRYEKWIDLNGDDHGEYWTSSYRCSVFFWASTNRNDNAIAASEYLGLAPSCGFSVRLVQDVK